MTESSQQERRGGELAFWLIGAALVLYVACLTGQRENAPFADAWEHHRVILALQENLWRPGNPTFASDTPSIRYSPYFIVQAILCRVTHVDPYRMLSWAAAVNTALLVLAVRALLRSFGEARASAAALIVMVCLYGAAPGWAGSYALSDLPWHQVNPSAFALALVIFAWALFRRFNERGWRDYAFPVATLLLTEAMLDHAMAGAFGFAGLFVIACVAKTSSRIRLMSAATAAAAIAAVVCLIWPWYPFLSAVLSRPDRDYWFDRETLLNSLFIWPAPALACALCAVPLRKRELVRVCFAGAAVCFALGLVSFPIKSPLLARLPMCGILFLHLAIAVYVRDAGILQPSSWPARIKGFFAEPPMAMQSAAEIAVAVALVYFWAPQCAEIFRAPHLARGVIAPITHKENKQTNLKQRFDVLLKPVGAHDVVLSDRYTSWPMPSSRGRIVAALHYEFFIQDQAQRDRDVDAFFGAANDAERMEILQRYNVKWIVLDNSRLGKYLYAELYEPSAEVGHDANLYLLDAAKWRLARENKSRPVPASS